MQTYAKYTQIYKYMQTYANYMYAIICKYMQTYANICKPMHIYANICSVSEFQFSGIIWAVRISNYGFAPDVFVSFSYFELIWKGITTEHFHCFREYSNPVI